MFKNVIKKHFGKFLFKKKEVSPNFVYFESRRYQLIEHILYDEKQGVTKDHYTDHNIIVSLTTYGKRIHEVAFTIESIMQQTMKANRIILWLDKSFEGKTLPVALRKQQKRGLEIAYCDDIRSYKKLIPSLQAFPKDAIITIDDDLLYDYDILEHLITAYLDNPAYIHCCRVRLMRFDKDEKLLPYNKWKREKEIELGVNKNFFITGGGGTLYPPQSLDEEVLNREVFMDICPYADDVWFTAMACKKGTPINKVYTRNPIGDDFITNMSVQDVALANINTQGEKLNDVQIKAVFGRYLNGRFNLSL